MREMNYNPGMRIMVGAKSLDTPKGAQNYLEVADDGEKLTAVKWHIVKPRSIPRTNVLIRF
jgi:hypothetical protein